MQNDKWFFVAVFVGLVLCPLLVFAAYPVSQYPYVPPIEKMQHNGEYGIYVLKEGKWQDAGKLNHDEFFRERTVDLSRYISGDNPIRIRIVQKGGESAHIDSVLLGDRPPIEVLGVRQGLAKLSKQDFDVIDAYGKSLEVIFNNKSKNKTLKLTGRVEDINRGLPFQFPLKNLCQKIDANAQFYPYRLNSRIGSMKLDGQLNEVSHELPFFKEYSHAITGHPSNYTYGWVRNDQENLYVAIDFTADNTWDGEKDFAKVYVNTGSGVKEFKVSVPETTRGTPGFTYTNKVGYQHKVYEFRIPLKEIGKENVRGNDEILLAFSAYGTAATTGACCYGSGTSSCTAPVTQPYCTNTLHGFYAGTGSTCISASCQPGVYIYEALIDSIPGGGEVVVVQGNEAPHAVQGIDYIVAISFDGSTGTLGPTNTYQYQGAGPGFVNINSDSTTHTIGYGNGYDGASVVEFRVLKSFLENPASMQILYHASRALVNDYTSPFQYPASVAAIPSLSQRGMIVLSVLLALLGLLILRQRKTATAKVLGSLIIVLVLSGVVWAFVCTDIICLDGAVDDWNAAGINPSVVDTKNDSSAGDSFEDIFAGYITSDDNYYYFRMDADVSDM
ncbi:MAG TPA: hypothetical protein DCY25_09395 [Bacteroidales bacterium]|nr:hypothetical protein [Bacteroidales bacterium]